MENNLWDTIRQEVSEQLLSEPDLGGYLSKRILQHDDLMAAISDLLAGKLSTEEMPAASLKTVFNEALRSDPALAESMTTDLLTIRERDPAVKSYSTALLYFKGFQALQCYRVAHWLWGQERFGMALYLQSQVSEVFGVDIHPAAKIGRGVLFDHATGIVIGETCVLEDNISIFQGVTLGGSGKESGDRHPKVRTGVLIGAGANVLGNVTIGEGAWIGAGSVVLSDVEAHTTVVGVPAKVVGRPRSEFPALDVDHSLNGKD